jgi:ABC-type transporter Mla MlaB component
MSSSCLPSIVLRLEGELSICVARSVASQWQELLKAPGAVTVNVEALGKVDTAGLQLLLSLKRTCVESFRAFSWQGASPMLEDTARRCGLAKEFCL